jgi:hypothetical protein
LPISSNIACWCRGEACHSMSQHVTQHGVSHSAHSTARHSMAQCHSMSAHSTRAGKEGQPSAACKAWHSTSTASHPSTFVTQLLNSTAQYNMHGTAQHAKHGTSHAQSVTLMPQLPHVQLRV